MLKVPLTGAALGVPNLIDVALSPATTPFATTSFSAAPAAAPQMTPLRRMLVTALLLPVMPMVGAVSDGRVGGVRHVEDVGLSGAKPNPVADRAREMQLRFFHEMRSRLHWSGSSFLINTLALICTVQGRQVEDKKGDHASAASWYKDAAGLYEYGKCLRGAAQANALYALAKTRAEKDNMDAPTLDEIVERFKRSHGQYLQVKEGRSAEMVVKLCAQALGLIINEESVSEQLREMPFIAQIGDAEKVAEDARKLAAVYCGLAFDKRESLGKPPRRSYVPYALISEYFRKTDRRGVAELVEKWGVYVNPVQVANWLSVCAPERSMGKELDDAILHIRRQALDPEFRHLFVRQVGSKGRKADPEMRFGIVAAPGLVKALEALVYRTDMRALPKGDAVLSPEALAAAVAEDNRSSLFYEAYHRRQDQERGVRKNVWPSGVKIDPIITKALELLEPLRGDRRVFNADGRLLKAGVVRGIDMAIAAYSGPGWGYETEDTAPTLEVPVDDRRFEVLKFNTPNEALLHCVGAGMIRVPSWDETAAEGREQILVRVRYAIHDLTRAMREGDPAAAIFQKTDGGIRVDMTALQQAVDTALESQRFEAVIAGKYSGIRRIGTDSRWAITRSTLQALAVQPPETCVARADIWRTRSWRRSNTARSSTYSLPASKSSRGWIRQSSAG